MEYNDNPLKGQRYLTPNMQKKLEPLKRVNAKLKPVNDRMDWLKAEQQKLINKKNSELFIETSVLVDTLVKLRDSLGI